MPVAGVARHRENSGHRQSSAGTALGQPSDNLEPPGVGKGGEECEDLAIRRTRLRRGSPSRYCGEGLPPTLLPTEGGGKQSDDATARVHFALGDAVIHIGTTATTGEPLISVRHWDSAREESGTGAQRERSPAGAFHGVRWSPRVAGNGTHVTPRGPLQNAVVVLLKQGTQGATCVQLSGVARGCDVLSDRCQDIVGSG